MRLSHLTQIDIIGPDPEITLLCDDSREVRPGALFFALPGNTQDGAAFADDAVTRGAAAIVSTKPLPHITVPVIVHDHPRALMSICAARLYPRQPGHIVAVTGTSGKTSTTYFVQQLVNLMGRPAVSMGTLGLAGAITRDGELTTPKADELHRTLDDLAQKNIDDVAIEASSQGLHQHRLDQVRIQAAAFLNLTRDHLDYHGTPESYVAAKAILFDRILPAGGTAILNTDDPATATLQKICAARGIQTRTYGRATTTDFRLSGHTLSPQGQIFTLMANGTSYKITTQIAGAFQAGNIIAALALATTMGFDLSDLIAQVPKLVAPPGRLEPITGHPNGAHIYVDYAHKPDALENVLTALRAHHPARLVCVFGCGGDRDAGKRPLMGAIAARLADTVIITDDNPRSEDPAKIRAAILAAAPGATEIGDRRAAITQAIESLNPGDILVVAGKGHETGQKFATHTEPFSDIDVCRDVIATLSSSTPRQQAGC